MELTFKYNNPETNNKNIIAIDIRLNFKDIFKIINSSHKESTKAFIFKNNLELFKS